MSAIVRGPAARPLRLLVPAALALAFAAGLTGAAPPAWAALAVGAPPTPTPTPTLTPSAAVTSAPSNAPAGAAPDAPALQPGRIASVDVARGAIVVHGRTLVMHPAARIVDAAGRPVSGGAAALRPGDAVRLALEPETSPPVGRLAAAAGATAAPRRVVLLYLDAR